MSRKWECRKKSESPLELEGPLPSKDQLRSDPFQVDSFLTSCHCWQLPFSLNCDPKIWVFQIYPSGLIILSHVWGCGKTTKTKKWSPNKLFILRGKNAKMRITVNSHSWYSPSISFLQWFHCRFHDFQTTRIIKYQSSQK